MYQAACAITFVRSTTEGSRPGCRRSKFVKGATAPWRFGSASKVVQMAWSLNAGPSNTTARAPPAPPARVSTCARICWMALGSEGCAGCALVRVVPAFQCALLGTWEASGVTPSPPAKKDESDPSADASTPGSFPARPSLRPGRNVAKAPAVSNRPRKSAAPVAAAMRGVAQTGGGPEGSSHTRASRSAAAAVVSGSVHGSSYVPAPLMPRLKLGSGLPGLGGSASDSIARSHGRICGRKGRPSAETPVAIRASQSRSAENGSLSSEPAAPGSASVGQSTLKSSRPPCTPSKAARV